MGFQSVLSMAHQLTGARLQPGDAAIDATAGTGADTLFLALACGRRGAVFSFDVQAEALALTGQRLAKEDQSKIAEATLLHRSHADMLEAVPAKFHGRVGAVMFNLGYLPAEGADLSLITEPASTIAALEAAITLLRPRGIITAVLYPGHPGGEVEAAAVQDWAAALPLSAAQSLIYRQLQKAAAPYLIAIEKK
ncbi:class I SAM-dependent methyltransferase [Paenibacillus sp. YPG26]|uniref:class I SAM-dependent methyltransferase n=1 Tax=Paenibacillus sp. YPG26 TaxID=2878915 RepID=UPI00203D4C0F|nr:class I SAM-dependent methyltransferase [Paenibacillus sp. YPG26]USB34164.1 SAM-dependent methyltransferase [Paenibacillus sp. YPG26]